MRALTALIVAVAIIATIMLCAWQYHQLETLRTDLATAHAQIEGYKELDKFRLKQQAAAIEAAALDRELSEGVGGDAPLSDYMRRAAGRVWP